jgi:hypothetical protein
MRSAQGYFIFKQNAFFIVSLCLALSCLVLSCLVLSCLVLSYLILSCLVLGLGLGLVLGLGLGLGLGWWLGLRLHDKGMAGLLVMSCLVLPCLVLSCRKNQMQDGHNGERDILHYTDLGWYLPTLFEALFDDVHVTRDNCEMWFAFLKPIEDVRQCVGLVDCDWHTYAVSVVLHYTRVKG